MLSFVRDTLPDKYTIALTLYSGRGPRQHACSAGRGQSRSIFYAKQAAKLENKAMHAVNG